jgi:hypothetical protein
MAVGFNNARVRKAITIAAVVIILTVSVVVVVMAPRYSSYVAVFYIGAMVGMGELVSRYRDAPERALGTTPAILYVLINGLASFTALYFVITFSAAATPGDAARTTITRVLLAGFGAMAFFRTSLFTIRVAEQDIAIGPAAFLQIILNATDRAVDRARADARADIVAISMAGVSFNSAQAALPAFCLALMQNVTADEEKALGDAVKMLQQSTMDDDTKTKNLGLTLLNVVGDKVLSTAVRDLAAQIKATFTVAITAPSTSVKAGQSISLTAVCSDSASLVIPGKRATWSADDATIASVSQDGRVHGIKAGQTPIRAKSDGQEDSLVVTVTP